MNCPYCGKNFKSQGLGPHKVRCSKNPNKITTFKTTKLIARAVGPSEQAEASTETKRRRRRTTGEKPASRILIFERGKDNLYHCPWCDTTSPRAAGLGAHCASRHPTEHLKLKAAKGYSRDYSRDSREAAGAITLTRPRTTGAAKVRGGMQKRTFGIDLTIIPFEKLPLIGKGIREEIAHRAREVSTSF